MGMAKWTSSGAPVCTLAAYSLRPSLVADDSGGAIVAWADGRAGNALHIFAQRVDASGRSQWTTNGVALCTAPNGQDKPVACADGAHGAIVAWADYRSGTSLDLYAVRVSPVGAPLWPADGVPVCATPGEQSAARIAPDGVGGAIVTWQDHRGPDWDIYAQRVTALGTIRWAPNGVALCTLANDQNNPTLAPGGPGGAIVAWTDARVSAASSDIYAQGVDSTGAIPAIVGVLPARPSGFRVLPAAPNPMHTMTTIPIELAAAEVLSADVFDLRGAPVRSLATRQRFAAGASSLTWDGSDGKDRAPSAGHRCSALWSNLRRGSCCDP
jgi:hypothetical protein